MNRSRTARQLAGWVVTVMLIWPAATLGQLVGSDVAADAQASWNSLSGSAISARAPGNVVRSAQATFSERHGSILSSAIGGPTVSAEEPGPNVWQQAQASAVQTLVTNLNALITALSAFIGTDLGLPPPTEPPTGGDSSLTDLLGDISGPA